MELYRSTIGLDEARMAAWSDDELLSSMLLEVSFAAVLVCAWTAAAPVAFRMMLFWMVVVEGAA